MNKYLALLLSIPALALGQTTTEHNVTASGTIQAAALTATALTVTTTNAKIDDEFIATQDWVNTNFSGSGMIYTGTQGIDVDGSVIGISGTIRTTTGTSGGYLSILDGTPDVPNEKSADAGWINLSGGTAQAEGDSDGGSISMRGGAGVAGTSNAGGVINMNGGQQGPGGVINMNGSTGYNANGGTITMNAGTDTETHGGTITMNGGITNPATGGSITMNGGDAPAGSINLSSIPLSYATATGGSINMIGKVGAAGTITMNGSESYDTSPGGSITMSGGESDLSPGGTLNLDGGASDNQPSGSINLSAGRASIVTSTFGGTNRFDSLSSEEYLLINTSTGALSADTLSGARTWTLPDVSGTVAIISGTTTVPSSTAAPVAWTAIEVSGSTYKIPLYQ